MKCLLLFLLCTTTFSIIATSQQALPDSGFTNKAEATNKKVNGVKEGKWVEYYREYDNLNGAGLKLKKLQFIHTKHYHLLVYKAGKQEGIDRQYDDGKLFCITPYKNGKIDGVEKCYNDDGTVWMEATYTNDTLNGVMKHNTIDGQLRDEGYYDMDRLISEKSYYPNGRLSGEGKYTGVNWVFKNYDDSGKLTSTMVETEIDSIHYIEKNFYENGQLHFEALYTNGEQNEVEKTYYRNGKLESENTYVNGYSNGPQKDYYENGVLWKDFNEVDNEIDGVYSEYYKDGKLAIQCIYKHGKLKQIKYFDDKTGMPFDKNGNEIK